MKKKVMFWRYWLDKKISPWIRYSSAVILVSSGVLLENTVFHIDKALDATVLESITVAVSLIFGLGPGIVSAIIAGLAIDYMHREPLGLVLTAFSDYLFLLFYIGPSLVAGILVGSLRTAFAKVSESEKQTKAAIAEREEMLSIVSHDLRTPITSILLNIQLLQKLEKANATVEKTLNSVVWAAKNMNELIQNLLDASKVKSGTFSISKKETDLTALIHNIVSAFEPLAQNKGVSLELAMDKNSKAIVDSDRISQVLSNLIGNAIKFTQKGGTVTVAIIRNKNKTIVSVSDTGAGIEDKDLSRIFDRHWQGSNTRQGAGLGLYISQGLIKAHGSEIKVKSQIGEGTIFSFYLDALN